MKVVVNGAETHVATGGKEFDLKQPAVLFLHGSGLDHRSWALQTRWFAYNGYSVLAPDFPAHSLSSGKTLTSIEESALWLQGFLHEMGVSNAHIIGHSQGFLSALELAKNAPDLVASLIGVGTASAIPVNQMLIDTAQKSAAKAANMMLQWGFGQDTHMGVSPTPGMQPIAVGRQIMSQNPLAQDLQSCANYTSGDSAIAAVNQFAPSQLPRAMILATHDKMTPLKAGLATAKALGAEVNVIENAGHMLPIEAPKQVLAHLRTFITKHPS